MHVDDAITAFLTDRQDRKVSIETMGLYQRQFLVWQQWRQRHGYPSDLADVTVDEFHQFVVYLATERIPYEQNVHRPATGRHGLAPRSVDSYYKMLRAFWNWLALQDHISEQQVKFFAPRRIPRPAIIEEPVEVYREEQTEALYAAALAGDTPEECQRDAAIICLLLESGMRANELCSLDDAMIDRKERRARICGKGKRIRWIYWGPKTQQHLLRYLAAREGEWGGPLFRGIGSRNQGKRLTRDALRSLMRRLAKRAGVTLPKQCPVHAFRHTFAHRALERGADISEVSRLLGHSSIAMTMRYLRFSPDELQAVHRRLFSSTPDRGSSPQRRRHGR
jgi:site-specific recombinase XerD